MVNPKSNSDAEIGVPPTRNCFSSRLQLRGRTEITTPLRSKRFPPKETELSNASRKLAWLSRQLFQVGDRQSSKSAARTLAPEAIPRERASRSGGTVNITLPNPESEQDGPAPGVFTLWWSLLIAGSGI